MNNKINSLTKLVYFFSLLVILSVAGPSASAQSQSSPALENDEVSARGIWPPTFRPNKAAPRPGVYKRVASTKATTAPIKGRIDNTLGITLWRLRSPKSTEQADIAGGRIIVVKNGNQPDQVPERVSTDTVFSFGQNVRVSIETPRAGYLYVIDREAYDNDTFGEPQLIYPQYPNNLKNRVSAGRVTEIPNQEAPEAVFSFLPSPTGKTLKAELLTILITPKPLTGLPNGDGNPIKLDADVVADLEKQYVAEIETLELKDGAGAVYTHSEHKAAGAKPIKLKASDPLPQTVFRIGTKPGQPFILRLPLKIEQK